MALRFWSNWGNSGNTTGTVTTSTTTTTTTNTAGGSAVIPDAVRGQLTNTYFQLTLHDHIDATAFGDTQRTLFTNWEFQPAKASKKGPTAAHLKKIETIGDQLEPIVKAYAKTNETLGQTLQRLAVEIEKLDQDKAELKARLTLEEHLDEEQLLQFRKDQSFLVKGKTMTYRLSMRDQPRIVAGPNQGVRFCVYTKHQFRVPKADEVLGMKLFIEANEEDFLKTANANSEAWLYLDTDGNAHAREGYDRFLPYIGAWPDRYTAQMRLGADINTLRRQMAELQGTFDT